LQSLHVNLSREIEKCYPHWQSGIITFDYSSEYLTRVTKLTKSDHDVGFNKIQAVVQGWV
jgi:hypothetical protein